MERKLKLELCPWESGNRISFRLKRYSGFLLYAVPRSTLRIFQPQNSIRAEIHRIATPKHHATLKASGPETGSHYLGLYGTVKSLYLETSILVI